jgi:hypothetical protein
MVFRPSDDGLEWHRHGADLSLQSGDSMAVPSPCVIRLLDGRLRLWFAARHVEDTAGAYRLWSTDYHGGP